VLLAFRHFVGDPDGFRSACKCSGHHQRAVPVRPGARRPGKCWDVANLLEFGEDKGFLSCTAAVLIEIATPYLVREVKRQVVRDEDGIPDVIVEFRNAAGKIVSVRTDSKGRFRIKHQRPGTYRFKATLSGFSSVVGTVVLTKKAIPQKRLASKCHLEPRRPRRWWAVVRGPW
jgi:hypothetical protein